MKKRTSLLLSLLVGLVIFIFFLYRVGLSSIISLFENIQPIYALIFLALGFATFFLGALRLQIILKAYNKNIPIWELFKQYLAGFSIAYLTPSVRLGGEPLKAYMLKKESNVDLKTGTSGLIIDKFVELTGSIIFGTIGLILLFLIPGISLQVKIILSILIIFTFSLLLIFYYRTITSRSSFSSLSTLFKLHKISKLEKLPSILEDIEKRLAKFFKHHHKHFLLSFFYYFLFSIVMIVQMKFLFLAFGIDASLLAIILAITILGIVNFIPVPAALGFLEAGQSSLFMALEGQGEIGFAFSLMMRLRDLIAVAIGFAFIAYFSTNKIRKDIKNTKS